MIERRLITDRAEWLSWRKADVTASNVGALFGCHPYVTALRLYAEKRGTEFEPLDEQSKVLRRGRWLEPAVAGAVAEMRPGWLMNRAEEYLRNPDLRLGATPDFYIRGSNGDRGILQIKTVAPSVWERDWLKGAEPPFWVLLQAATEMMLDEAMFAAVAVMLVDPHNLEVAVCEFERNLAVEAKIVLAVGEFWKRVELGEEPEQDFGRDRDVVRALRPKPEPGKVIDLRDRNDLPEMLAERASMLAVIKEFEEKNKAIETELMHRIGDAETALIEGFRVTFKTVDVKGYTVAPRSSRQLRIYDRRSTNGGRG